MKFSIVTPSYNKGRFITETIASVISQKGDFEIEYIIIDNLSIDDTARIVRSYQDLLEKKAYPLLCRNVALHFVSEQDSGMYDAINRGFEKATGDIYAWINADDIYLPGAFSTMAGVFELFPNVRWAKGITSYIDGLSRMTRPGRCLIYDQNWLEDGVYGRELYFVQQDSTFWRADLWKETGGIPCEWKYAGDYWLWTKFAGKTPLFCVNTQVSCFRQADGQLSSNINAYRDEVKAISSHFTRRHPAVSLYLAIEPRIPEILKKYVQRLLFGRQTYHLLSQDDRTGFILRSGSYHEISKVLASMADHASYSSLEIS